MPILIVGGDGALGRAVARACHARRLAHHSIGRKELDITAPDEVARMIHRFQPRLLVNAAGYSRIDTAEHAHELCRRANVIGPEVLARACARSQVRMLTFSCHLVFDGDKRTPYTELDPPRPLGAYGRSKLEASCA